MVVSANTFKIRTSTSSLLHSPLPSDTKASDCLTALNEDPLQDEVQRSELDLIIRRIHVGHQELLATNQEVVSRLEKLQKLREEEKKLKVFLNTCGHSTQVWCRRNETKQHRVRELKEKLRVLRTSSRSVAANE